ncbi:hypothetical protein ACFWB2_05975 [Streptomyces virginiae]|uniref:hypothetical protein n=1 Tax=Streptomyces TaxID=1883 RepID=UPI000525A25B|nr:MULTISPECIES: hypothetical protein [Streptomyces]MCX4721249.1 hypothetical protein [Streptomyces virginiae]MCX5275761.1 hypothetical protein [Streptomyces virginiae]MYV73587.1 hypothetical protein [Streptomyces sp. SID1046]WSC76073.1 hypothetical protein OHA56_06935 [Streptomyces virginiae]
MRSTRTAKTANTTAAACLVVLAGMFVGTGAASTVLADTHTTTQADGDMPWGVVKPVDPPRHGSAGKHGDMPWG